MELSDLVIALHELELKDRIKIRDEETGDIYDPFSIKIKGNTLVIEIIGPMDDEDEDEDEEE